MTFSNPQSCMLLLGGAALALPVVLVAANIWLRWQRHRARPVEVGRDTVESSKTYRRYLVAAASTDGSGPSWDHSIRPVLAELVESVMVERHPGHTDLGAFGRESLGARLWEMIDRPVPRWQLRAQGCADRQALVEILEKLERSTSQCDR